MADQYFTYVLRCADGSYYVGSTSDLVQRVLAHNQGRGASWTAARIPVRLVHQEVHGTETEAVQRERQIKRWTRAKKEALIAGDRRALNRLAKSGPRSVPAHQN